MLTNDNEDARRVVESCYKRHKTVVNPIIEWSDEEVWEFIKSENIPYCELYDEGFHRLGCIGCPLAGKRGREQEFARWPKYLNLYLMAFEKMLEERKRRGKTGNGWNESTTATDVFNWWMEYDIIPGQVDMFEIIRNNGTGED